MIDQKPAYNFLSKIKCLSHLLDQKGLCLEMPVNFMSKLKENSLPLASKTFNFLKSKTYIFLIKSTTLYVCSTSKGRCHRLPSLAIGKNLTMECDGFLNKIKYFTPRLDQQGKKNR